MFSRLLGKSLDDKYVVGQIWEYHTRKEEEKSTFTIVAIEKHKKLGTIINIHVKGLMIKNPNAQNGFLDEVQHLPFSKDAIEKSVIRLIATTKELPNYKNGYDEWKTAFDKGKAGIFSITVQESIDVMEKTLNQ